MSCPVSVLLAQRYPKLSVHPICMMTSSWAGLSVPGRAYVKLPLSSLLATSEHVCQKPLDNKSILANIIVFTIALKPYTEAVGEGPDLILLPGSLAIVCCNIVF
jgi:hypothetical protein